MRTKRNLPVDKLVLTALMTAFVVVFQLLGTFTAFFGPFSTAVALIPIVIGAALCGVTAGAWLGLIFGVVVLASGGAALFLFYDIPGTIITVLVKGVACGFAAGIVFKWLKKYNFYFAVVASAIICPIVNTGCFMLGCAIFFMDSVNEIASAIGSPSSGYAIFWGMAIANFLFEIGMNILVSPIMARLLSIRRKG